MVDPVAGYDARGEVLAPLYEGLDPAKVHADLAPFLPSGGDAIALDIGAGSGRDAAWLRRQGFKVVAVEPARGMRAAGQSIHSDAGIRWLDDRLPDLVVTQGLGLAFDVILLSGVLMHVRPNERPTAFRQVAALLKPGGRLLISVRDGEGTPDRPMWPVTVGELEDYARAYGVSILRVGEGQDQQARPEVTWTTYAL